MFTERGMLGSASYRRHLKDPSYDLIKSVHANPSAECLSGRYAQEIILKLRALLGEEPGGMYVHA